MVNESYTICPWHDCSEHIRLRCKNHPELGDAWGTKNIDFIGARSIFYHGNSRECDCSLSKLYHTCKDSEEYALLCKTE